jgi:hypothetical protein
MPLVGTCRCQLGTFAADGAASYAAPRRTGTVRGDMTRFGERLARGMIGPVWCWWLRQQVTIVSTPTSEDGTLQAGTLENPGSLPRSEASSGSALSQQARNERSAMRRVCLLARGARPVIGTTARTAAFAGFPVRGLSAVHDVVVSSATGTDDAAESSAVVSQHRALHVAVTQDLTVINERAREVGLKIGWTLRVGARLGLQSAVSRTRSLEWVSLVLDVLLGGRQWRSSGRDGEAGGSPEEARAFERRCTCGYGWLASGGRWRSSDVEYVR